jgi:type II secretory pathway pseudopilin PulG
MAASSEQWEQADPASDARDQGFTMVATLSVVALLAILVTITLSLNLGTSSPPGRSTNHSSATTTTTAPKSVASGATEATTAACEANFAIVNSALEEYRSLDGGDPPAGTAWATYNADGGALLETWPSDPSSYTIAWNGRELSVIPARGAPAHGSLGNQALKTGCYAL